MFCVLYSSKVFCTLEILSFAFCVRLLQSRAKEKQDESLVLSILLSCVLTINVSRLPLAFSVATHSDRTFKASLYVIKSHFYPKFSLVLLLNIKKNCQPFLLELLSFSLSCLVNLEAIYFRYCLFIPSYSIIPASFHSLFCLLNKSPLLLK